MSYDKLLKSKVKKKIVIFDFGIVYKVRIPVNFRYQINKQSLKMIPDRVTLSTKPII